MLAMVLASAGSALEKRELPEPECGPGQVKLEVLACGVCRTDLHVRDGELPEKKRDLVLGHQVVGRVIELGDGVEGIRAGDRLGVPWLGWTCGACARCAEGRENLCDRARFTGYEIDGGFAQRCVADARFCLRLPDGYADAQVAPLLCAGLIGHRAYRMAGSAARRIGIFGFGAAGHVIAQVARHEGREVFAFTRKGDDAASALAMSLGASWAGSVESGESRAALELDAALIFAPDGALVPEALRRVRKGGVVVCAGIHMSDVPSFPYSLLWGERTLQSVANLTRRDGEEFLALAPRIPVRTEVHPYPLASAERALSDLRAGRFTGAAVLVP